MAPVRQPSPGPAMKPTGKPATGPAGGNRPVPQKPSPNTGPGGPSIGIPTPGKTGSEYVAPGPNGIGNCLPPMFGGDGPIQTQGVEGSGLGAGGRNNNRVAKPRL